MKYQDADVKLLMEQNSPKKTLISFLMACVYGAAALLAAMKLRALAEAIAVKAVNSQSLMSYQYGGIVDTVTISTSAAVIILWLMSFFIVWHSAEKAMSMKSRIRKSAIWTVCAIAVYGLAAITAAHI